MTVTYDACTGTFSVVEIFLHVHLFKITMRYQMIEKKVQKVKNLFIFGLVWVEESEMYRSLHNKDIYWPVY